MKYEKTQRGNPHDLTVEQHVFPARSIGRFVGADGCVDAQLASKSAPIRIRPQNGLFRTRRTWDQKAERLFMKGIEDKFQELADKILDDQIAVVEGVDAQTVNLFYALWYHRSRLPHPDEPFVTMNRITPSDLTKDQQEILESKGVAYYGPEGMPARFLTGIRLQILTGRYAHQIRHLTWGIIRPLGGEFLVPDIPSHNIMPIDPKTCLVSGHPSGQVTVANLREINAALIATSSRYVFACNIRSACSGVSWDAIQKAGAAYERARIAQEQSSIPLSGSDPSR